MPERRASLSAVVVGIALIVVYSMLMMTTSGSSSWAWLLLIAGIALLVGGEGLRHRKPGE